LLWEAESNLSTVPPQGGDFADPMAALAAIPPPGDADEPSATNPYVVLLGPGVYDLGGETLAMLSHVSIKGSGIESTIIQSNGIGAVVLANVLSEPLAGKGLPAYGAVGRNDDQGHAA